MNKHGQIITSASDLQKLRKRFLDALLVEFSKAKPAGDSSLKERKSIYCDFFASRYESFRRLSARRALEPKSAEYIACEHAAWMDAWIHFTWKFVLEEESLLMGEVQKGSAKKIPFLEKTLPEKNRKKAELEQFIAVNEDKSVYMDSALSYYRNTLKEVDREIGELERELDVLREIAPQISAASSNEEKLLKVLLIFARGGYGRRELSFSSDIDIGYCVDVSALSTIELHTIQELFKRMEHLFHDISPDIASQYFELGENLSRFGEVDNLHTIPSIFEGRKIIGAEQNLATLKSELPRICSQEKIIRYLQGQLDQLVRNKDESFYIKEGFGGVRHLQFALWMALIVDGHESGNTRFLLERLKEKDWISSNDEANLLQALEFYLDLRNFLGLYEFYHEDLESLGYPEFAERKNSRPDILDDQDRRAYLKLKDRFVTIDGMDRFRLHSINKVQAFVQSTVKSILDRTVVETLPGFTVCKHLETNRITKLESIRSSLNRLPACKSELPGFDAEKDFFNLFTKPENLFHLFRHIAVTGSRLRKKLESDFSLLIPRLYETFTPDPCSETREFIFELFKAEHASIAIEQMMDISAPLKYDGEIRTLLGLFFPEANKMRYLIRNAEIHEYPLCIHSLKALRQVEEEIDILRREEPELWLYIKEDDIFVLKWSVLFHDLGKINPGKRHEKFGAELSTRMLSRLGWDRNSQTLTLIRLLIANHQSVVLFSRLSTYPDLAILKFFELAQRDPAKVILLYLINLADFKSVNPMFGKKSRPLERFFQKTVSILEEFKRKQFPGSIKRAVNNYLDSQVDETGVSVLVELLVRQVCNKNLNDIIISPLEKLAPEEAANLKKYSRELERSIVFLKLAELDADSLTRHKRRFRQIVKQTVSKENIFYIAAPLTKSWDWFFKAVPNRYLLSSRVDVLASQLKMFEGKRSRKARFSFCKGEVGEYDSLIFNCADELAIQAIIAYAVSWKGFNIESGKINRVVYADGTEDIVGFFTLSQAGDINELSNIELENIIDNMNVPRLDTASSKKNSEIQIDYFEEDKKGYLVTETYKNAFSRERENFAGVKISLKDAPFCFYKILRSFKTVGAAPRQITITTIGDQIIDYFYLCPKERKKINRDDFKSLLQSYIDAEICLS